MIVEQPNISLPPVALTADDTAYIASRLPKDVRELLQNAGTVLYVAGGFIRAVVAGEEINDIDLWCADAAALRAAATRLKEARHRVGERAKLHTTDNAVTLITENRKMVQIITRWVFTDVASLVRSFDFTVCAAAVWWEHGAWHSAADTRFYSDLAARRLIYTAPKRVEEAGGSLLRVLKYVKRGYSIQVGSLAAVVARLTSVLDPGQVNMNDEAAVTHVYRGLLRMVDPSLAVDGMNVEDVDA